MFIWALTVGIHLTFCCGPCDLSSLVGMTRRIYIHYLNVKSIKGCKVKFYKGCFSLSYITSVRFQVNNYFFIECVSSLDILLRYF